MIGKFLKTVFILAFLMGLAFWSPWKEWNFSWFNLIGINQKEGFSSLRVQSFSGNLNVYVDDELQGVADSSGEVLEILPIEPGNHILKLTREEESAFFYELVKEIPFSEDIDVIVGYELGPSAQFSEGHILYSKKSFEANRDPILEIFSPTSNVSVKLDGVDIGQTPINNIELSTDKTHKLLLEKDGYDSLEIQILPDSIEEREKLRDYILTLDVSLFARPLNLVTETDPSEDERT